MFEKSGNKVVIFGPEIWPLQENGGVSRYCFELISNLSKLGLNIRVLVGPNENIYSKQINPSLVVNLQSQSISEIKKAISLVMTEYESGIYHATYFNLRTLKIAKMFKLKTFVTVHDLIGEIFPAKIKWFQRRNRDQEKTAKLCDCVISVSENTKRDVIQFYKIESSKINVIHLGVSAMKPSQLAINLVKEPYVIHVGNRNSYKNFFFTVKSISQCTELNHLNIVAFGGGNFTTEETNEINSLGMNSRILHLKGDDTILAALYESAVALIYPSLYEGFGIPPLEAMRSKCPVIASDRASMPEVCGTAILYIDPTSEMSLQDAVLKVLKKESGHSVELAFQHSMNYSWEKTAKATLDLYESNMDSNS